MLVRFMRLQVGTDLGFQATGSEYKPKKKKKNQLEISIHIKILNSVQTVLRLATRTEYFATSMYYCTILE